MISIVWRSVVSMENQETGEIGEPVILVSLQFCRDFQMVQVESDKVGVQFAHSHKSNSALLYFVDLFISIQQSLSVVARLPDFSCNLNLEQVVRECCCWVNPVNMEMMQCLLLAPFWYRTTTLLAVQKFYWWPFSVVVVALNSYSWNEENIDRLQISLYCLRDEHPHEVQPRALLVNQLPLCCFPFFFLKISPLKTT